MNHQTTTPDGEIRIERTFEAPREQVFRAWLDPEHLTHWYGPEHFTAPEDKISVQAESGGEWRLVMVDPGGNEHPIDSKIVELVEPELLVLENEAIREHGISTTRTRVEFHDEGNSTRMVMVDGPYEGDMGEMAGRGWAGAFDKLASALQEAADRS